MKNKDNILLEQAYKKVVFSESNYASKRPLPNGGFYRRTHDHRQMWTDKNDDYHREDGPAIIWGNGKKVWCKHGKIHRLDGPAVEYPYGDVEYFIDGKKLTVGEWKLATGRKLNPLDYMDVI